MKVAVINFSGNVGKSTVARHLLLPRMPEAAAVIDIGASNVEDFIKLMQLYRGSHEDFDFFVVPAVKEAKQIKDTIATISALAAMGVPADRIRVVFNKLDADETVEEAFYPLIAYHADTKSFRYTPKAVLQYSELYQKLRTHRLTVADLLADATDYKASLRTAANPEEKAHAAAMISMRRLAASAQDNLDAVYAAIAA